MDSVFRFPTEAEKQPFCLDLGYLGYAGACDFPMSPVSDASQFSPILDSASSLDLDFDMSNCVYCGVGLGIEAMYMEWEQRVCEMCTRALVCCSPKSRASEHAPSTNMEQCHHCGISLDGEHVQVDGHVYCRFDYESLFVLQCRGCGTGIADSYVEALDSVWHKSCFRCAECGDGVGDKTSFLLNDRILCGLHYYRLRDAVCMICHQPLKGLHLSTPDGKSKFHPTHFQCYKCHHPLPQSNFTKEGGHFICLNCTH